MWAGGSDPWVIWTALMDIIIDLSSLSWNDSIHGEDRTVNDNVLQIIIIIIIIVNSDQA